MTSLVYRISALAVTLVWFYVAASLGRVLVPLFQRLFFERVPGFELEEAMGRLLALLLACALLLGLPFAWCIVRSGSQDAECSAYRSALSVWPGWPLAVVGFGLATVTLLLSGIAQDAVLSLALGSLDGYAFAIVPLVLATCAAVTGGCGNQAAAFLAAPTLLITSVSLLGETSIANSAVAVLAAWALLAAGFAVLAGITSRELFMWLAIGFASFALLALPLATGLFTPSEVVALVCALAVICGLLLYRLVDGVFPWRVFTVGAVEILAVGTVWVCATLALVLVRIHGTPAFLQEFLSALPGAGVAAAAVAVMLVASVLLTPVVAIAFVVPVFAPYLAAPRIGLLLALAGVAAMCLRAIHWRSEVEPASSLYLSPAAGLAAIALLLAGMALSILFWDVIAITPLG